MPRPMRATNFSARRLKLGKYYLRLCCQARRILTNTGSTTYRTARGAVYASLDAAVSGLTLEYLGSERSQRLLSTIAISVRKVYIVERSGLRCHRRLKEPRFSL